MGRALGVDLGTKRIGFALSDPDRVIASNFKMVECQDDNHIIGVILDTALEAGADLIVLGHPINMDGSLGPAAERAEKFRSTLSDKYPHPVVLWDERLTSKTAHDVLIEAGTRRNRRKELVDKIAAQIMLQGFLDVHTL